MKIRELLEQTDFELANQEPSQQDIDTIQDFIDTIDPQQDTPKQVLTRLQQLQPEYRDWETDRKSTRLNSSH